MKFLFICGHGNGDSGATGNGFREDILSRELVDLCAMKGSSKGLNITIYSKDLNCYKESLRGRIPNYSNYDYVVEFHFNAFNGQAFGSEILVHTSEKGVSVEETILRYLSNLGFRNRGVKRRNDLLNMNKCKSQGTSYALIETCFIDNVSDMEKFNNSKHSVAEAIIDGIIDGFGLSVKTFETTLLNNEVVKGDRVQVLTRVDYNGVLNASWVTDYTYDVLYPPKGNRVVIGRNGELVGAWKKEDLRKV